MSVDFAGNARAFQRLDTINRIVIEMQKAAGYPEVEHRIFGFELDDMSDYELYEEAKKWGVASARDLEARDRELLAERRRSMT